MGMVVGSRVRYSDEQCNLMLKEVLGLPWEGYQQAVIDEFLCIVAGCAFGTGVCHWTF